MATEVDPTTMFPDSQQKLKSASTSFDQLSYLISFQAGDKVIKLLPGCMPLILTIVSLQTTRKSEHLNEM